MEETGLGQQQHHLQDIVEAGRLAFDRYLGQLKRLIENSIKEDKNLSAQLDDYGAMIYGIKDKFSQFRNALREVPIAVAITHWMKGLTTDPLWYEAYFHKMIRLQDLGLIPYFDTESRPLTLDYFIQQGHQELIERIRCTKECSLHEREEMVECYVRFSHSLARDTYGVVPHGFDPDRNRVRNKAVRYEAFLEFVQQLPERDGLIAKLLYFGSFTIDDVLVLTRDVLQEDSLSYKKLETELPRHVLMDLRAYLKDKPESQRLVFANVRGAEVERAHLNQSFARACEKITLSEKITPGSLLR